MSKVKSDPEFKKEALKRIAIAMGHLQRVQKMLEDDDYCPNVIHQSRAVQASLKKVDEIVLHGHLHTCVFNDIHGPKSKKEKVIGEMVDLFSKNHD